MYIINIIISTTLKKTQQKPKRAAHSNKVMRDDKTVLTIFLRIHIISLKKYKKIIIIY